MQSIKTKMDWHIQESLMVEVYKADPENTILNKFINMQNHLDFQKRYQEKLL